MDYQQKYLKYKNKYLELKYNQKSGFTGKSGLYTYFTSEQILKDNEINYFPNAKAPSIYTINKCNLFYEFLCNKITFYKFIVFVKNNNKKYT